MYVYLDESGNLTGNGKYFIVGSYTVGDPKRIANAFRKWQRSKFPRKLKVQAEVKFNDSHLDDELREKTLRVFAQQDIRIFYTYLKVNNIPESYRKKGGLIKAGLLYTEIMGETLDLYLPVIGPDFRVFRDRRILKGVKTSEFNQHLTVRLLPKFSAKTVVQIQAVDSTTSPQVQVADWVCGALNRYLERKPAGDKLYNILKNNIVKERELFTEYWNKKWDK